MQAWNVILSLPLQGGGKLEVPVRVKAPTWQLAQAAAENILARASVARVLESAIQRSTPGPGDPFGPHGT